MHKSSIKPLLAALTVMAAFPQPILAEEIDGVKVYYHDGITVSAKRDLIPWSEFRVEKGNVSDVLDRNGFSVIRKGVFLAQDIYADGMKKSDIPIVIDDERYQCACPNRMDAPVSRIAPLDIDSVELDKSASHIQAGLGGIVSVRRTEPGEEFKVKASLSQAAGSVDGTDVAVLVEGASQRISLRYAGGSPYEDGSGRSFRDQYGYRTNTDYRFAEASYLGIGGEWKYAASFMFSEDVSFPYLKMDERNSKVYNASVARGDVKLYMNYTDHLMDNGLRTNYSSMPMSTRATNLTVGAKGSFFDAYFRHWNADNRFMAISNHMIPDVNLYAGSLMHKASWQGVDIAARAGIAFYRIGDGSVLPFIRNVHPGAADELAFPTFALSFSDSKPVSDDLTLGGMLDVVSEAPEAESLFSKVQKASTSASTNSAWTSGNPNLDQPLRGTLRTSLSSRIARLELFGSYIWNYVNLDSRVVNTQKYLTYDNVDAVIAGASIDLDWKALAFNASWTYGENASDGRPLPEILPLRLTTKLTSPEIAGLKFYVRHRYENAQGRIDTTLQETSTAAWNAFDIGMSGKYRSLAWSVDVENLGDETYSRHISYLRDPFTSGSKVYEPGLTVLMNLRWSFN